nr:7348_t:CDS:2 [Entrophospora candida]
MDNFRKSILCSALNNTVFLPSRGDNSFTSSTNKRINEESSDLNPPLKIYLHMETDSQFAHSLIELQHVIRHPKYKISSDDNSGNNFSNNTRSSCKSGAPANTFNDGSFILVPVPAVFVFVDVDPLLYQFSKVDVDLIKKRSLSLCGTDESHAVQ